LQCNHAQLLNEFGWVLVQKKNFKNSAIVAIDLGLNKR
jgi:Tfp pilus assembly protein PilF